MPTVMQTVDLSSSTMTYAVQWYRALPATLRACPAPVLSLSMHLAGGNQHRLTTDGDGTIIVWNHPRW